MFQQCPLIQIAPFTEFTSVTVTEAFSLMFDVEKIPGEDLSSYCQCLVNRIFRIPYSKIPNFIGHHCNIAKDPLQWLNRFEELVLANVSHFSDNNKSRLTKLQACIEVKRYGMGSEKSRHSLPRPERKEVNAESEERYFSFNEVREKLDKIKVFEEKIVLLTNQKYDYQQSVLEFINSRLPKFDKLCDKEIERLKKVRKIKVQSSKIVDSKSSNPSPRNKIRVNSNINQFVDVFFQLNRELQIEGKPFLDGNTGDFVKMICNNFVDREGHDISSSTVETILRPSKYDKRPKSHRRIDVDKLI